MQGFDCIIVLYFQTIPCSLWWCHLKAAVAALNTCPSATPACYCSFVFASKKLNLNLKTKSNSHPTQQRMSYYQPIGFGGWQSKHGACCSTCSASVSKSPTTSHSVQLTALSYLHAIAQFLPQVKAERS